VATSEQAHATAALKMEQHILKGIGEGQNECMQNICIKHSLPQGKQLLAVNIFNYLHDR
jgi:hypothetical protein